MKRNLLIAALVVALIGSLYAHSILAMQRKARLYQEASAIAEFEAKHIASSSDASTDAYVAALSAFEDKYHESMVINTYCRQLRRILHQKDE